MQQIHKFKEVKDIINKELVMIVAKSHDCSSCKMINKMLETNVKNLDQIEVYNIYIDESIYV